MVDISGDCVVFLSGATVSTLQVVAPSKISGSRSEHRWPAVIALLVALSLYASLPSVFFAPFRYVVVAVGVVLLIPLIALNPKRLARETRWSKYLSTGQGVVLVVANEVALVQLIVLLVSSQKEQASTLLLAALQVWVTNIIAFALVFWELDRGGPVSRRNLARPDLPAADFRFPQDEDHDAIDEVAARSSKTSNWVASFFDYFYFSASNSMAFSPTDTMPLTIRAKALMVTEAASGFVLLGLVIARAVSLLG